MSHTLDKALQEKAVRKAALREEQQRRALAMREEGLSIDIIAERLQVGEAYVRGLLGLDVARREQQRLARKERRRRTGS